MIQIEKIDQERYHKQINKANDSPNHLHAMVLFFNTTEIFCSWTYSVPCLWCEMKNKKKKSKKIMKNLHPRRNSRRVRLCERASLNCFAPWHPMLFSEHNMNWLMKLFQKQIWECFVKLQRFNHTRVLLSFKPSAINSAPRSPMTFAVEKNQNYCHFPCSWFVFASICFLPAKLSSCKVEFTFKTCPIALAPAVRTLFPVHLLSHFPSSPKNRSF